MDNFELFHGREIIGCKGLAVPDLDLGSLSESGRCSFYSHRTSVRYKGKSLLPLRPFDFPPSPHPASQVPPPPLQSVMELDFQIDTSWCMGCSKQILPKRSYVPLPQQLAQQPPTRMSSFPLFLPLTHYYFPQPQSSLTGQLPTLVRRKTP